MKIKAGSYNGAIARTAARPPQLVYARCTDLEAFTAFFGCNGTTHLPSGPVCHRGPGLKSRYFRGMFSRCVCCGEALDNLQADDLRVTIGTMLAVTLFRS